MRLFLKILLYIFALLIAKVNATSASITFPNIQETTTSLAFHREAQETIFKVVENDLANCCQNGNDLVNYRDWGKGVEAVAAKTGWKVGEPITNQTAKGNVPAWSTVRQRFWKNEAFLIGDCYLF